MIIKRSWRLNKKAALFNSRPHRMYYWREVLGDDDPEYGLAWKLQFNEMRRLWRLS